MANVKTIRRAMKIWRQVTDALYPFAEQGVVVFTGKGKIVRHPGREAVYDAKGKEIGTRRMRENFLTAVLRELPPDVVRRFVWPSPGALSPDNRYKSEPEPTDAEFAKFRNLLLGTARRRLLHGQVQRIKNLPRLPGPGRWRVSEQDKSQIRRDFKNLKDSEEIGTATQAVKVLATRHRLTERGVWKILSQGRHRREAH